MPLCSSLFMCKLHKIEGCFMCKNTKYEFEAKADKKTLAK